MPLTREELLRRARTVEALVLDVDGVLTDASLVYGPRGEELKSFSARDGFATKLAVAEGIAVAVLSGRAGAAVQARLAELGVPAEQVVLGSRDKGADIERLAGRLGLPLERIAFMGDDLPDLPALAAAGLAACPADAPVEVRDRCDFVASAPGGHGAVRELVRLVLEAKGRWPDVVEAWWRGEAAGAFFAGGHGPS